MRQTTFGVLLAFFTGTVLCGETTVNPASPDAAQKLQDALKTKGAVVRIEPGVIEGEFEVGSDASIIGAPEDPAKVTIRVKNANKPAIALAENASFKATGITFSAATGIDSAVGASIAKNSTVELVSCKFEGPLTTGVRLTDGSATLSKCVFSRLKGDAIVAEGGKFTVSDTDFSDIPGCAIKSSNSILKVSHAKVTYSEKGGITATGGEVAVSACTFENCSPSAVDIRKAAKTTIADCIIKNTTEDSFIVHDCGTVLVKGNQFENSGASAIWIQGTGIIEENTVRSSDKGVGIRANGEGITIRSSNKLDHLKYGIGARNTKGLLVENNQIRWCGTGLAVYDSEDAVAKSNTIQSSEGSCALLVNSKKCIIVENTLGTSARGVLCQGTEAAISKNTIKDCSDSGIKVEKESTVEIDNNSISGSNALGIAANNATFKVHDNTIRDLPCSFEHSSNCDVYNNTVSGESTMSAMYFSVVNNSKIHGNTIGKGQSPGMCIHGSPGSDIYDNTISGRKAIGVHVLETWDIKFHHNICDNNAEAGLMVESTKNVSCYANEFHHNGLALRYDESKGEVYDNIVRDNNEAIVFWENAEVNSHHNECFNNKSEAILYRGSWGESHHNHIHNNEWGYFLKSSRGKKIIVHDNDIHDNRRDGIRAEWTADCEIFRNRIVNNQQCGIRVKPQCPMNIYENLIADSGKWGVRAWEDNEINLLRNIIVRNAYSGIAAGKNKSFLARQNTIVDNRMGGIWAYGGGAITLERNIIYKNGDAALNTHPLGKEGEEITGDGTINLKDNVIYWNGDNNDFAGPGVTDDGGNVSQDPLLTDPDKDVFVPMAGSPAISGKGTIGAIDANGQTNIPFGPIPGTGPQQQVKTAAGQEKASEPSQNEEVAF